MTQIDGYTDLRMIGQGGFAIVYQARQVSVGRDVAIKLLTDPSPDDDLVRRFQRESQAVGALSWHPHIAAVVDAGSTALGQAYIVFELLQGGSLEERVEAGAIDWYEASASMIQVADAVEAAHRADVLHRDIKPANILLDRLGVAKLGDFGIASMQDGNKTATGILATTIAHAAPELFDGHAASPATDIYALGSTLHTLVTGVPPFEHGEGDRISAAIARIASEPPPRPDPERVPEQVATIIAHALAKQPEYRPRSAAAFGQALQQAQRELGRPVTAMPITDSEPIAPTTPSPPQSLSPTPESTPALLTASATPDRPASAGAPVAGRDNTAPFVAAPPLVQAAALKPLSKTIAVLSVVAALLTAGVTGLVLYQTQRSADVVATTTGGAVITSYQALEITEMAKPFDAISAVDRDDTTYWGIAPVPNGTGIAGTSYVIKLAKEQRVTSVGISNGSSTQLGRISGVIWATTINELEERGPTVINQPIPNEAGSFITSFKASTNQIVLAITGVHDDAPNAGIAEILIQIEGRPNN